MGRERDGLDVLAHAGPEEGCDDIVSFIPCRSDAGRYLFCFIAAVMSGKVFSAASTFITFHILEKRNGVKGDRIQ